MAISTALSNAANAEIQKLDSFYPYLSTPSVDVLGIVVDPAGVRRLHFLAHDINYNAAQSGSDWANHYVLIGTALLEGETPGEITLKAAVNTYIREADWSRYETGPVVEEVRDQVLGELGVSPPKPDMETVRIVRCPYCGSTDAGEIEALYEITRMSCHVCGHTELCDSEEIKDEWNVSHERRKDRPRLPGFVPPLATAEPGFELRGAPGDETRLLVHPGTGYAIAVPGSPYMSASAGGQSAVVSILPYIQIVVRAESRYSELAAEALLRQEIEAAARLRAIENSALDLEAAPVPPGATASMFVTYPRRVLDDVGDLENITELLAATIHDDKPSYFKVVFLYIAHTTGKLPEKWTHLRTALLAQQTWQP